MTLPEPLVPPEVDLRDFVFMPLDVLRLRDSDLAALSTGDEFKAAVLLWCVAWHQVPAGSLPDDDRLLARHSGAGPLWKKVRAEALRGFVKCSDGRLYHATIAEKALESWSAKLKQRERTRAATEAREARRREQHAQRNDQRDVARDVQRESDRNEVQGTVKGQGQVREEEQKMRSDAAPTDLIPPDPIFGTGLALLVRKGIPEKQARSFLGKLRRDVGDLEAIRLLADAEAQDVSHPIEWLSRCSARKTGPPQGPTSKTGQGIAAIEEFRRELPAEQPAPQPRALVR